jgi:hypothetical protein
MTALLDLSGVSVAIGSAALLDGISTAGRSWDWSAKAVRASR